MPIIKREAVRLEERPARPAPRAETSHTPSNSARLLRVDGVVHAVEVTCKCGEVIVIELSYDEAQPEPAEQD